MGKNVGYTTHQILREHRTHREQVIKMFEPEFLQKTIKCIKSVLMGNIVQFFHWLCFMSIVRQFCLDCYDFLFMTLLIAPFVLIIYVCFKISCPNMTITLEKSSMICLGLEYLIFLMNIISVMDSQNLQDQQFIVPGSRWNTLPPGTLTCLTRTARKWLKPILE